MTVLDVLEGAREIMAEYPKSSAVMALGAANKKLGGYYPNDKAWMAMLAIKRSLRGRNVGAGETFMVLPHSDIMAIYNQAIADEKVDPIERHLLKA